MTHIGVKSVGGNIQTVVTVSMCARIAFLVSNPLRLLVELSSCWTDSVLVRPQAVNYYGPKV